MSERRIKASHPDFSEIDRHQRMLCILKNPETHFNSTKAMREGEFNKEDQSYLTGKVEREMEKLLEGGIFRDFIETIE